MKKLMTMLVAMLVVGCGDPTEPPIGPEPPVDPEPPVADGYPINVRWWICPEDDMNNLFYCGPSDRRGNAEEVGIDRIPNELRTGTARALATWSEILEPTQEMPYIVPRVPELPYRWECWVLGSKYRPSRGDTLPAGLTLHIVYFPNIDGVEHNVAARTDFCGEVWLGDDPNDPRQYRLMWEDDKPPEAPISIFRVDHHDASDWQDVIEHEMGHVIGAAGGRKRWGDHYVKTDTGQWITHPHVVASFDSAGGADYPGRKVPVTDGGVHWHPCIAKGDVMSEGSYGITNLTLGIAWPGFKYVPQSGLDSDASDRWDFCPEFKDSGSAPDQTTRWGHGHVKRPPPTERERR